MASMNMGLSQALDILVHFCCLFTVCLLEGYVKARLEIIMSCNYKLTVLQLINFASRVRLMSFPFGIHCPMCVCDIVSLTVIYYQLWLSIWQCINM